MQKAKTSGYRLQYLDWVRGIGALIMLQGHVFHSFLKPDLREGAPYIFSQFVGGMPPAIFLFLTGVTLAFLMDSTEKKGFGAGQRVWLAARRSGYLFAVAILFRVQLWMFAWPAPASDILRVDILNCMGFAILAMSPMALFRTGERIRLCAVLGAAIAFAAPLVSQVDWSGLPSIVKAYVAPDPYLFGFFPWGAYLAFGMSAGSIIRRLPNESTERAMQWAALAGGGAILACQYFSSLPYSLYTRSDYWLNSPALVLTKLGVVLVMLSIAFLWTRYGAKDGWSWVRQIGTTSLLVYWVHIELVYGRWLYFWKNALTVQQAVAVSAGIILLMIALSVIRTNWQRISAALGDFGWGAQPERVSGD
jgi:fucose 4-O-acetylase-like acetyltransferase